MDNFIEPSNKNKLDYNPQPDYVEKTIFLKVLIQERPLYIYIMDQVIKNFSIH